jgi:precorrin-2 dehydrogenase/sirohydrochlorin ferrochelatase
MAYFPMFIELKKAPCLIVGGGKVAYRKVVVLKDFEADITVVSPVICDQIKQSEQVICKEKEFDETDLKGKTLVVAATDDKALNHKIAQLCRSSNIVVNAVDQIEDCDFIFGAYVKEGDVVAAISSSGKSPVITQYLKAYIQNFMTEEIGIMADFLGDLRERVKNEVETEEKRKRIYQELLKLGLEKHEQPNKEEIEAVISKYNLSEENQAAAKQTFDFTR